MEKAKKWIEQDRPLRQDRHLAVLIRSFTKRRTESKFRESLGEEKNIPELTIDHGLCELKFGKEGVGLFNEVQQIQEMSLRIIIRAALKFISDLGELQSIYQPPLASN